VLPHAQRGEAVADDSLDGKGLDEAAGHYNRGTLLTLAGEYRSAVQEFELAVAELPKDHQAYVNLAVAQWALGDLVRAESAARQALELASHNGTALNVLGLCAVQEKRRDEAVELFKQAVTDSGAGADACLNLGNVCRLQQNRLLAEQYYRQALTFKETAGLANLHLGNLAYQDGGYAAARDHWQQALLHRDALGDAAGTATERNLAIINAKIKP
jgi:Tfp pilus assembly protein PilF